MPMLVCLHLDRVRERRLEQEQLRKVKTLGAASEDVDDLGAWVSKSRALEEKAKADARAKALKQARMLEEQVSSPSHVCWSCTCGATLKSRHIYHSICISLSIKNLSQV